MKKYIPLLLATSLLLSACSIGWGNQNNLDNQEKCYKQSLQYFNASNEASDELRIITNTFTNHYNQKLNKCFIESTSTYTSRKTWDTVLVSIILSDPYEDKIYWSYSEWQRLHTEKEPSFTIQCEIKWTCNSRKDFDEYIKPFMEN